MPNGTKPFTLPGGFAFDLAAATAHVMQPSHTRDVISSRGLEEGTNLKPLPAAVALSFNTDGFIAAPAHRPRRQHILAFIVRFLRTKPVFSSHIQFVI